MQKHMPGRHAWLLQLPLGSDYLPTVPLLATAIAGPALGACRSMGCPRSASHSPVMRQVPVRRKPCTACPVLHTITPCTDWGL